MLRQLSYSLLLWSGLLASTHALYAQSIFGRNLVVNGDAESGPGDPDGHNPVSTIPGWKASGSPDVVQYASSYDIAPADSGPLSRGKNYFYGGRPVANSSLSQTVDLSSGASTIDAGTATFSASAYLGGYQDEPESAQMGVTFLDGTGRTLSTVALGPVTVTDRENTSGLWYRRAVGQVPVGARSASVVLALNYKASSTNDGAADNLSLVLNAPANAQSLLNTNLIVNGNAETSPVSDPSLIDGGTFDVPGWNRTGLFTIDAYNESNADLNTTSPGPADRGLFYFYGGVSNPLSSAFQDIDVSSAATLIDTGTLRYALSAWLGGFSSQEDNAVLSLQFRNWAGTVLGTSSLGPVTSADRDGTSALLNRSATAGIPSGTRVIRVMLTMTRTDGSDNDAMADSLSLVLTVPGTGPVPAIAPSGVVSAAGFGGFNSIAPGSWIEIYGTNLSSTTRGWGGGDFNGANAPTSLDGVKVTVGNTAAYVDYVSPTQVNAQVSSSVGTGPQLVTVTNSNGTSAAYTITVNPVQPGLLAPPAFNIGGKQYVVATLPDGTYVLPQGAIAGLNSRPARPGETVTIYGVGFGSVSPNIPAGQIVGQVNSLTLPLSLSIGGTPTVLPYKGLAPNFVGLYQFNVTMPNVSDNNPLALTFNLGGTAGTQTLYTSVHQ